MPKEKSVKGIRSNAKRAKDAATAVTVYAVTMYGKQQAKAELKEGLFSVLNDLMTDLRHLAVANGIEMDRVIELSYENFREEDSGVNFPTFSKSQE